MAIKTAMKIIAVPHVGTKAERTDARDAEPLGYFEGVSYFPIILLEA